MRLLNISSLEFKSFGDKDRPQYAIASHRWDPDETTFKDFLREDQNPRHGEGKVLGFCQLVERMNSQSDSWRALGDLGLRHRCEWLWIDTCCINKEDSAELSESINSMFRWYGSAAVCYAYLADVKPSQKVKSFALDLTRSDWFKRGWTLQELIAPRTVVFLASNWEVLGHKCAYSEQVCAKVCQGYGAHLNRLLAQITGIPFAVIGMAHLDYLKHISVDQKMGWAQPRSTTRIEDRAYCLLGLLDVFISPIYGEGEYAWTRLLQQIEYKQSTRLRSPGGKPAKKSHRWFRLKKTKKAIVENGSFATQTTVTAEGSGYTTMSAPGQGDSAYSYSSVPLAMSALDYGPYSPQLLPNGAISVPLQNGLSLESDTPPGAMSVPLQERLALEADTPQAPMSVPPAGMYRGYSYEANPALYFAASEPVLGQNEPSAPGDSALYFTASAPFLGRNEQSAPDLIAPIPQESVDMPVKPLLTSFAAAQEPSVETIPESSVLEPVNPVLKHRYGSAWSFHYSGGYESVWIHELPADIPTSSKVASQREEVKVEAVITVRAHSDFKTYAPGCLAFDKGDIITVLESHQKNWLRGRIGERTGMFPAAYVDKLPQVYFSTLAVEEEPGLADWIQLDSASPGTWTDMQSEQAEHSIEHGSTAKNVTLPGVDAGVAPIDRPSSLLRRSMQGKPPRRRSGPRRSVDRDRDDLQVRSSLDSLHWIPILNESQLSALHEPLRQAYVSYAQTAQTYTELSCLMYPNRSRLNCSSTVTKEPIREPIGFIESDKSVREDDETSIQSEHFETAQMPDSNELVHSPKVLDPEQQFEIWPDHDQQFQETQAQKGAMFVQSAVLSEPEEHDRMITIPQVVLKALLDPTAANTVDPSDQNAVLAHTAVEYIRSMLLSQSAVTSPPPVQQSTTTTVEAYRRETAKYQQISVAETLSTTTEDSSSSRDEEGDKYERVRPKSDRQSWHLHGVWADSN